MREKKAAADRRQRLNRYFKDALTSLSVSVQAGYSLENAVSGAVEEKSEKSDGRTIDCPMVGVFYAASSPDAEPYVSIGSKVKKGDVVCIIEAMKLMNEVVASESGTVTEVLVKNGDLVEFGQPLFVIE